MKLSVRKKVANGLVICLVAPGAIAAANEMLETYANGLAGFAAEDNFDLTASQSSSATAKVKVKQTSRTEDDPTGSDPSAYDPSGFDPDGYDPSGGDPSGCLPANPNAPPALIINAPQQLITAEDGSADLLELLMQEDPLFPRTYYLTSTKPWEAKPEPNVVTLYENACIPQSIWVIGQNDYIMDGDIDFDIEIRDEQDSVVGTVPGVNLDNDNYPGFAVDVLGPTSLPKGGGGLFLVRVANVSGADVSKGNLYIEPTDQLEITSFATALLSGEKFKGKGKMDKKSGALVFNNIDLQASDMLIVSVDAMLGEDSTEEQALMARFQKKGKNSSEETDDTQNIRTAVPGLQR